jgi:DNA-binding NtrC family response regulator
MKTLNILVCSSNRSAEQTMARRLTEEGTKVQTSNQIMGSVYSSQHNWDFVLIDLDGLDSFLRTVLPIIHRRHPDLPLIGIWTNSSNGVNGLGMDYGLELDAYFSELPRPEDLIVNFPQVIV